MLLFPQYGHDDKVNEIKQVNCKITIKVESNSVSCRDRRVYHILVYLLGTFLISALKFLPTIRGLVLLFLIFKHKRYPHLSEQLEPVIQIIASYFPIHLK